VAAEASGCGVFGARRDAPVTSCSVRKQRLCRAPSTGAAATDPLRTMERSAAKGARRRVRASNLRTFDYRC
jgi:hypothetical protein